MNKDKQYPAEVFTWMITVAQMPILYYGRLPMHDLYQVFQSGKDVIKGFDGHPGVGDIDEKEFSELLRGFLSIANLQGIGGTPGAQAAGLTCKIVGDEVISLGDDEAMENLRKDKMQRNLEHKILSYDEVMQIIDKGYLTNPAAVDMEKYLMRQWKKSETDAVEITRHLVIGFRTGDDLMIGLSELIGAIGMTEKGVTADELQVMLDRVKELYSTSGQMVLYGWSPNELYRKTYGTEVPKVNMGADGLPVEPLPFGATLVPGSSSMAAYMKEHSEELKKAGVEFDLEASAGRYTGKTMTPEGKMQRSRSKKVYSNDPCPCGSGRKYRDCHGRQ